MNQKIKQAVLNNEEAMIAFRRDFAHASRTPMAGI